MISSNDDQTQQILTLNIFVLLLRYRKNVAHIKFAKYKIMMVLTLGEQ
jgi:hypothetical protein